jgi:formiminotetrahydrofolate cyclodeaminase
MTLIGSKFVIARRALQINPNSFAISQTECIVDFGLSMLLIRSAFEILSRTRQINLNSVARL